VNRPPSGRTWPPIVISASVPFWIRARDILLAIIGWMIVQDLLIDFWVLMYDWLKDPIFELDPADSPDWAAIVDRLAPFATLSALLVAGIALTAIQRRRLIARTLASASQPAADASEISNNEGAASHLQRLRVADVHIDADGGISRVEPRSGR
jgi:hypothetical protein